MGTIRQHLRVRQGVAMVEMAIVLPLLMIMLFGIIEVGLIIKDVLGLNQAAREGARVAAVGATVDTIGVRIDGSAPTIDTSLIGVTAEYRELSSGGTWSGWIPLTNVGTGADLRNCAGVGDQIRITLTYPHALVAGRLFQELSDGGNSGTMTLTAKMIMRRE